MKSLMSRLRRMVHSEQGSVALIIGVAIFALVLGAGAAIDMSRAEILQSKIQSSLDESGLAVLASMSERPAEISQGEWAAQQAQRFFDANFPSRYLGTTPITINATVIDDNTVTLTANAEQTTTIMQMAGITKVNVGATTQVKRANTGSGLELVLALDNTSSMLCNVADSTDCSGGANSKIVALKDSAKLLLDIIYGPADTSDKTYVGIVPFSQAVNIGNSHIQWLGNGTKTGAQIVADTTKYDWGPNGGTWGGCIVERTSYDSTDEPPTTAFPFFPYWFPPEFATTQAEADTLMTKFGYYDNFNPLYTGTNLVYPIPGWRQGSSGSYTYNSPLDTVTQGPNLYCPVEMLPMQASKAVAEAKIDSMIATGQTLINEGAAWAWRMLSPRWRGTWGGEMDANSLPGEYNVYGMQKVMVLMTDGWSVFEPYNFTAFGKLGSAPIYTPSRDAAAYYMNLRLKSICDNMRAKGIIIYTIGFGRAGSITDESSVNVPLLQQCAGDESHFFLAPTVQDLRSAFTQIGRALVNLRVVK